MLVFFFIKAITDAKSLISIYQISNLNTFQPLPINHIKWATVGLPAKWRFADRPIVVIDRMLAGQEFYAGLILPIFQHIIC